MFHFYGLILGISIIATLWVVQKKAERLRPRLDQEVERATIWMFVFGVIGARLYHLVTDWDLYRNATFLDFIAVWNGGLGIFGAVLGAFCGLGVFVLIKGKFSLKRVVIFLDLFAYGAPLGQAIGRWGNFVNQELYGKPTTLPWGIFIEERFRLPGYESFSRFHPLFLYESVAMISLWLAIWFADRKGALLKNIGRGKVLGLYLIGYGIIRFSLEFLRIESARVGVLSIAQVVSIFFILIGFMMVFRSAYAER